LALQSDKGRIEDRLYAIQRGHETDNQTGCFPLKYRKEIDGLRAVAVLPVILHHAGLTLFKGGYLGVDIFFVISGYLITSLVVEQISNNSFSLAHFYERRARRILPALFFVMLVCIPFAWWLMLPDDLENFGQSLVATTAMLNNVLLYYTSGYWALESAFKPLVHTWSLGVEEQYYLVTPLFILLVFSFGRKALAGAFLLVFLGSIIYSQQQASQSPVSNFLMLSGRAWELAVGALLAMVSSGLATRSNMTINNLLSWLGCILIVVSLAVFDQQTRHPGYATLLPVAGTSLVILFANSSTVIGRVLSQRLLVLMGLVSYSAYLWHQPLFAFVRLASLEEPGVLLMSALGLLSFVLAGVSWRYVEQPCRNPAEVPRRVFLPAIVAAGIVIAGIGLFWHNTSGQMQRWPELAYGDQYGTRLNAAFNVSARRFISNHFNGDEINTNVLVIGPSFARDFINAGLENGYFSRHNLVYLPGFHPCWSKPASNAELFTHSDVIVFAAQYDGTDADCLLAIQDEISQLTDARLLVIGTKNFGWNINAVMRLPESTRYDYRARVMESAMKANQEVKSVLPAAMYVDQIEMIIDANGRVPVFTPQHKLISQDRKHLTKYGAEYIGGIIFEHRLLQDLQ
jgi:peptidoglycan/LPS O-acetylase OafA/YrhL